MISSGAFTRTEPPSMMEAAPSPTPLLMLATSRVAVVKSASFKLSTIASPCEIAEFTDFSTVAPFGMRPELGTLTVSLDPSVPSTPKPLTIRLPCAIA